MKDGGKAFVRSFFLRRLALTVPVVMGVVTLVFLFLHMIPGDPVEVLLGEQALQADREALRKELGLDRPLVVQYGGFVAGLLRGDLGKSIYQRRPVSELIRNRYPATLRLTAAAMLVSLLLALPAGVVSGLRPSTLWDHATMFGALLGVSMPNFWLGPLLILLFSIHLGLLPVSGSKGAQSIVLPALTLGCSMAAIVARMTRSSVLECLREDYVLTARAKGLSEKAVVWKHVLRNALLPVVTVSGMQFGSLLAGSIIIETIFSWPGLGSLTVQAIQTRDYPLVQGCVLTIALSYTAVNFFMDLLYGWIDPRIRFDGSR